MRERFHPRRLDGRYELLGELASGGMASVYLAQTTNRAGFRRLFAVKLCHPHMRDDPEFVAMFLDEARLAAMIHHPNVVPTTDVGEDGAELYLVMDYVDGERLSSLVRAVAKSDQRIPTPIVLRIMLDVLAGLGAAHDLVDDQGRPMKLVHRDVSPQNVMVGLDGVARLMDFGIARAEARATVTQDGAMKGKLAYMAPEQIVAPSKVDRRADLFAMGVVFWELLTGTRLLSAESQAETMHRVLHTRLPPPSRGGASTTAFDAVVLRALERSRDLRFDSADEMARAIEALAEPIATTTQVAEYADEWLGVLVRSRRERLLETGSHRLRVVPQDPIGTPSGAVLAQAEPTRAAKRHADDAPPPDPRRDSGAPPRVESPREAPTATRVESPREAPTAQGRRMAILALAIALIVSLGLGSWLARDDSSEATRGTSNASSSSNAASDSNAASGSSTPDDTESPMTEPNPATTARAPADDEGERDSVEPIQAHEGESVTETTAPRTVRTRRRSRTEVRLRATRMTTEPTGSRTGLPPSL